MQRANRNSEPLNLRQRCGGCMAFSARTTGDHYQRQFGICAWTNGDDKQPGSVHRDQATCVFRPSKFKVKVQ